MKHHPSNTAVSPIIEQASDALRRARMLPVGPHRNDLRQLAIGLLWLEKQRAQKQRCKTTRRPDRRRAILKIRSPQLAGFPMVRGKKVRLPDLDLDAEATMALEQARDAAGARANPGDEEGGPSSQGG